MVVTATALRGIDVRGSTFEGPSSEDVRRGEKAWCTNLAQKWRKGKSSISSKGPDHARRGGGEPDGGCKDHYDDYRRHTRPTAIRSRRLGEDLDEGVIRGAIQGGRDIAHTEQRREQDSKAHGAVEEHADKDRSRDVDVGVLNLF